MARGSANQRAVEKASQQHHGEKLTLTGKTKSAERGNQAMSIKPKSILTLERNPCFLMEMWTSKIFESILDPENTQHSNPISSFQKNELEISRIGLPLWSRHHFISENEVDVPVSGEELSSTFLPLVDASKVTSLELDVHTLSIVSTKDKNPPVSQNSFELAEIVEDIKALPGSKSSKPQRKTRAPTSRRPMDLNQLCQHLSKFDVDPHLLIAPYPYGDENGMTSARKQPFDITVHPQVGLLTDVHSHLCESEVIGLLAGKWEPYTDGTSDFSEQATSGAEWVGTRTGRREGGRLYIQTPFPCTSTDRGHDDDGSTDVELDPVAEYSAREAIASMGLQVVGWYHSHPRFRPDPSVTDVIAQRDYQRLMKMEGSDTEAFVGLIVSSYDTGLPTEDALHQWFNVAPYTYAETSRSVPQDLYIPMKLQVTVGVLAPISEPVSFRLDELTTRAHMERFLALGVLVEGTKEKGPKIDACAELGTDGLQEKENCEVQLSFALESVDCGYEHAEVVEAKVASHKPSAAGSRGKTRRGQSGAAVGAVKDGRDDGKGGEDVVENVEAVSELITDLTPSRSHRGRAGQRRTGNKWVDNTANQGNLVSSSVVVRDHESHCVGGAESAMGVRAEIEAQQFIPLTGREWKKDRGVLGDTEGVAVAAVDMNCGEDGDGGGSDAITTVADDQAGSEAPSRLENDDDVDATVVCWQVGDSYLPSTGRYGYGHDQDALMIKEVDDYSITAVAPQSFPANSNSAYLDVVGDVAQRNQIPHNLRVRRKHIDLGGGSASQSGLPPLSTLSPTATTSTALHSAVTSPLTLDTPPNMDFSQQFCHNSSDAQPLSSPPSSSSSCPTSSSSSSSSSEAGEEDKDRSQTGINSEIHSRSEKHPELHPIKQLRTQYSSDVVTCPESDLTQAGGRTADQGTLNILALYVEPEIEEVEEMTTCEIDTLKFDSRMSRCSSSSSSNNSGNITDNIVSSNCSESMKPNQRGSTTFVGLRASGGKKFLGDVQPSSRPKSRQQQQQQQQHQQQQHQQQHHLLQQQQQQHQHQQHHHILQQHQHQQHHLLLQQQHMQQQRFSQSVAADNEFDPDHKQRHDRWQEHDRWQQHDQRQVDGHGEMYFYPQGMHSQHDFHPVPQTGFIHSQVMSHFIPPFDAAAARFSMPPVSSSSSSSSSSSFSSHSTPAMPSQPQTYSFMRYQIPSGMSMSMSMGMGMGMSTGTVRDIDMGTGMGTSMSLIAPHQSASVMSVGMNVDGVGEGSSEYLGGDEDAAVTQDVLNLCADGLDDDSADNTNDYLQGTTSIDVKSAVAVSEDSTGSLFCTESHTHTTDDSTTVAMSTPGSAYSTTVAMSTPGSAYSATGALSMAAMPGSNPADEMTSTYDHMIAVAAVERSGDVGVEEGLEGVVVGVEPGGDPSRQRCSETMSGAHGCAMEINDNNEKSNGDPLSIFCANEFSIATHGLLELESGGESTTVTTALSASTGVEEEIMDDAVVKEMTTEDCAIEELAVEVGISSLVSMPNSVANIAADATTGASDMVTESVPAIETGKRKRAPQIVRELPLINTADTAAATTTIAGAPVIISGSNDVDNDDEVVLLQTVKCEESQQESRRNRTKKETSTDSSTSSTCSGIGGGGVDAALLVSDAIAAPFRRETRLTKRLSSHQSKAGDPTMSVSATVPSSDDAAVEIPGMSGAVGGRRKGAVKTTVKSDAKTAIKTAVKGAVKTAVSDEVKSQQKIVVKQEKAVVCAADAVDGVTPATTTLTVSIAATTSTSSDGELVRRSNRVTKARKVYGDEPPMPTECDSNTKSQQSESNASESVAAVDPSLLLSTKASSVRRKGKPVVDSLPPMVTTVNDDGASVAGTPVVCEIDRLQVRKSFRRLSDAPGTTAVTGVGEAFADACLGATGGANKRGRHTAAVADIDAGTENGIGSGVAISTHTTFTAVQNQLAGESKSSMSLSLCLLPVTRARKAKSEPAKVSPPAPALPATAGGAAAAAAVYVVGSILSVRRQGQGAVPITQFAVTGQETNAAVIRAPESEAVGSRSRLRSGPSKRNGEHSLRGDENDNLTADILAPSIPGELVGKPDRERLYTAVNSSERRNDDNTESESVPPSGRTRRASARRTETDPPAAAVAASKVLAPTESLRESRKSVAMMGNARNPINVDDDEIDRRKDATASDSKRPSRSKKAAVNDAFKYQTTSTKTLSKAASSAQSSASSRGRDGNGKTGPKKVDAVSILNSAPPTSGPGNEFLNKKPKKGYVVEYPQAEMNRAEQQASENETSGRRGRPVRGAALAQQQAAHTEKRGKLAISTSTPAAHPVRARSASASAYDQPNQQSLSSRSARRTVSCDSAEDEKGDDGNHKNGGKSSSRDRRAKSLKLIAAPASAQAPAATAAPAPPAPAIVGPVSLVQLMQGPTPASSTALSLACSSIPSFRCASLSLVTMALYYSSHPRRVELTKKWRGDQNKVDKVRKSAQRWLALMGLDEVNQEAYMDLLSSLLLACWGEGKEEKAGAGKANKNKAAAGVENTAEGGVRTTRSRVAK